MMVEAGGTEKSFDYYDDGAKKVDEAVLASGLEACKVWIKESIALQRQLVASVIATNGPIDAARVHRRPRLHADDVFAAVERVATDKLAQAVTIAGKAERNAATDAVTADDHRRAVRHRRRARRVRRPGEGGQGGRPLADQEARPPAASSTRASASTAVASPTCVRCRPRSACCRRRTAPACSSVARPRSSNVLHAGHAPHEPARRHADARTTPSATCTTTTCRRGPTARPAASVRRSAARSATAPSPPGPILPVVPNQEEFAYTLRLVSEVL